MYIFSRIRRFNPKRNAMQCHKSQVITGPTRPTWS